MTTIEVSGPVQDGQSGKPWTREEVELAVRTYMYMLRAQESGQTVNKSECNRRLAAKIPARNDFSISRKHSNISAVLTLMGIQTLSGYKPLFNFQRALADAVERIVQEDSDFDRIAMGRVLAGIEVPIVDINLSMLVETPTVSSAERVQKKEWSDSAGFHRDYLAREASNRSVGLAGEMMVLEFERVRLCNEGAHDLAALIDHSSVTKGDGLGFDVLSYNADSSVRRIEVKTTAYGIHTPIYVTKNELGRSSSQPDSYWLYRVFNIRKNPKIFIVSGSLSSHFDLEATLYIGHPRNRSIMT